MIAFPGARRAPALGFLALAWLTLSSCAQRPAATVDVAIFAINDFHGNLAPPRGGFVDPALKTSTPAGGAEYLATLIHQLRATHANSIFVGAGDLIGASPTLSAWHHDEPAIEALSMMGLEASSVGNHEFDKGAAELLRMQNGGCDPKNRCDASHPFAGARFRYLAANVVVSATGKTLFAPTYVKSFDGVPVAFIGLALQGTARIVVPAGVAGLEFRDEAETVNALVPQLRAQGIEAIVVLIHQGGFTGGGYNDCADLSGPIADIVPKLDKAVTVVVSGHTHRAYNCVIDGRLVTSASQYGMMVTEIDLKLDAKTHQVIDRRAENHLVDNRLLVRDPDQSRLISAYDSMTAQLENRIIGSVAAPLTRQRSPSGETVLGEVIADAQLAAVAPAGMGGAEIAFMNNGGVRSDILKRGDGAVTFGDLFAVQPFGNRLLTLTLTGAQIKTLLEQQLSGPAGLPGLQVSKGFSYSWSAARPVGDKVQRMRLNGTAIDPGRAYRVAVTDFLAGGGDGLTVLREGKAPQLAMPDIEALEAYFHANSPMAAGPMDRIQRN